MNCTDSQIRTFRGTAVVLAMIAAVVLWAGIAVPAQAQTETLLPPVHQRTRWRPALFGPNTEGRHTLWYNCQRRRRCGRWHRVRDQHHDGKRDDSSHLRRPGQWGWFTSVGWSGF